MVRKNALIHCGNLVVHNSHWFILFRSQKTRFQGMKSIHNPSTRMESAPVTFLLPKQRRGWGQKVCTVNLQPMSWTAFRRQRICSIQIYSAYKSRKYSKKSKWRRKLRRNSRNGSQNSKTIYSLFLKMIQNMTWQSLHLRKNWKLKYLLVMNLLKQNVCSGSISLQMSKLLGLML